MPSFGLSLLEHKHTAKESPERKVKFPAVKMPSIDISVPKAHEMQLPEAKVELQAKAREAEVSAEGSTFKFKMPQVLIPKFDISPKMDKPEVEAPSSPKAKVKALKPETDVGHLEMVVGKISVPKVDFSVPGIKPVELELPKPELDITVEKPKVELRLPSIRAEGKGLEAEADTSPARLSFPSLKMPSLEIGLPKVDLPKLEGEFKVTEKLPDDEKEHGVKLEMPKVPLPKFGAFSKDLVVEIDLPKCAPEVPEPEPTGAAFEGSDLSGMVAKIPKVDIAFGKEKGEEGELEMAGLVSKKLPKVSLEVEVPSVQPGSLEARMKLPLVEISAPKFPDVDIEAGIPDSGKPIETEAKLKSPKFSLPKFGISGLKIRKGAEGGEEDLESLETKGSKLKMPKFGLSFPKSKAGVDTDASRLSLEGEAKALKGKAEISGPRGEVESPKARVKFLKADLDLELHKGKVEVGGKGDVATSADIGAGLPDVKVKMPKFSLPKFGGKGKEGELEQGMLEQETKGVVASKLRGSREALSGEADGKAQEKEAKSKMPKFKMPSFGMSRRDVEVSGPEIDVKVKKGKVAEPGSGIPEEKLRGSFMKMPKLKISSPKAEVKAEGAKDGVHLQGPSLDINLPQIELPPFGSKAGEAEGATAVGSESPRLRMGKVKMPSLELSMPPPVPSLQIAMPGAHAQEELSLQKPAVDVSEADIKGYGGDLKIPGVSLPKLELDVSLPKASAETLAPRGASEVEAKLKMPKVELPKFGVGEVSRAEAEVHLLKEQKGKGPSVGIKEPRGTLQMEARGEGEASALGSKIRMPKLDISLPKARLSDVELPLTEGEMAVEGWEEVEGKFRMPSLGLPKFSTPKVKAPELEFDVSLGKERDLALDLSGLQGKMPKVEVSSPKIKLPKFGGSSSDIEAEADTDSSKGLKLELKPPKLKGGSLEMSGVDVGVKEAKIKMPSVPIGFGMGRAEGEATARTEDTEVHGHDSKFKLKMPSLDIAKAGIELKGTQSRTDTQPLCPAVEGADFSFRMPQIALPDVGFSVEASAPEVDKGCVEKPARAEDLDEDVGGSATRLKMPKIKMPTFGVSKGDSGMTASLQGHRGSDAEEQEGKKSLFRMPDLEISAPSIKAHAEYEVEGAQLHHAGSKELAVTSDTGLKGKKEHGAKAAGGKGDAPEADARKKYKVKLPKFGLALPKSGQEAGEGRQAQEADTKARMPKVKKAVFVLVRPKGKGSEGSSGLLEGEADATTGSLEGDAEGKSKMYKIKLRPSFGLSLSKSKAGAEVNGELEEGDAEKGSSGLKVPKLGFSKEASQVGVNGTGSQLNGEETELSLQNGTQEGKGKRAKIKLPQLELSTPYKAPETDAEMNLKLVRMEEAKEEAPTLSTFTALKGGKFKPPKNVFSGFKKKDGEAGPDNVVSSAARTEMALLEKGEGSSRMERAKVSLGFAKAKAKGEEPGGERSPSSFRFPKLALSPKSRGVLEITSQQQHDGDGERGSLEGFKIPTVGFSGQTGELSSEEQILEEEGGRVRIVTRTLKAEGDKSTAI
uniref:Periaxin n=1 Tax=Sphenodon punctatus TaxID=8508 RepID=A0A8D0HMK8_SPHPU